MSHSLIRNLVIAWLTLLVAAPLAAAMISGETDIAVVNDGRVVWAEIHGTRLAVPADKWETSKAGALILPQLAGTQTHSIQETHAMRLYVEPPSSSLYWQPAGEGLLYPIGAVGEWLQGMRPPAQWIGSLVEGNSSGVYRLKGGRALALLPLDDGSGNGLVLEVRPERASISWWTLESGQPRQLLSSASYRPSGWVSVGDMAAEVALVAWAASVIGIVAWLVGMALGLRVITNYELRITAERRRRKGTVGRTIAAWLAKPAYPPLALFVAGTVLASVVSIFVLDGIPHVQDEGAYIFQAKIFSLGRSWVPAPASPEFFQSGFVQVFDGRWFSKYPPGYPLLLVPGLLAGLPWLVNALSCGASLAVIYMAGMRMFGRHVAAWAGLLGLISPWVLFMSGSYMSHPVTMFWAALFLYALVGLRMSFKEGGEFRLFDRASKWGMLAGFATGMAFITREWTALGIGVGVALWGVGDIVSSRSKLRKLVPYGFVVAGFIVPVLFLLYENHALTGQWLRLAQDLVGSYDTPGFGPGHGSAEGHTPAMGVYNGLVYLRTLATMFDGWPAPFALAPIALGLVAWVGREAKRQMAWDALLWLPLAGLLGAYFFWWSSTTIYGARYWYEGLPFMLLMSGRGLDLLGRVSSSALTGVRGAPARWLVPGGIFALFGIYTLSQSLPDQARSYINYNDISVQPLREVQDAHLTNALVFVALDPARPNRDYDKVFFANDPLLQGDLIYARDRGVDANRYLASLYPGRAAYWLPLQGPPKQGVGP